MRRALALLASGALALAGFTVSSTPACTVQGACESSNLLYCVNVAGCRGRLIDDTHWESAPLAGKWVPFTKNASLKVVPLDAATGKRIKGSAFRATAWISACEDPTTPGCNYALASGNNAEWVYIANENSFFLKNNTCEDFFVRVVIESDGVDGGP